MSSIPEPVPLIYDSSHELSEQEIATLEARLRKFQDMAHIDRVVVRKLFNSIRNLRAKNENLERLVVGLDFVIGWERAGGSPDGQEHPDYLAIQPAVAQIVDAVRARDGLAAPPVAEPPTPPKPPRKYTPRGQGKKRKKGGFIA